eukprot:scaffold9156_cov57-Phaeocystis_antarctica.AAC.1
MTTLSGGTGSDGATAGADVDGAEAITESDGAGTAASRATIPAARPSQDSAARGGADPSSSRPLAQGSALLSIAAVIASPCQRAAPFGVDARGSRELCGQQARTFLGHALQNLVI